MNYISHFYFDRQHGNDYYNLGIILPDLARAVNRENRLPTHKLNEGTLNYEHLQLQKGCTKHYLTDRKFHNSSFFRIFSEKLKNIFLSAGFDQNTHRLSVTSHIFLEMMLDRLIISDDIAVADAFYRSLGNIETEKLEAYLKLYGIENQDIFTAWFNKFRESKYIYHYVNNESMLFSLNRVLSRVNIVGFETSASIMSCIDEAHAELLGQYHMLDEELAVHS
jgi:hypothetical protein